MPRQNPSGEKRLARHVYTEETLVRELGVPEEVIRRYFMKSRQSIRVGGKKAGTLVEGWSAPMVKSLLRKPAVRKAIALDREGKKREKLLQEARAFMLGFGMDKLRQEGEGLQRRFVLHIGPTNSGKTYQALRALKAAERGVYLGPLRLLALEVFDSLNRDGVPCHLLTGEESVTVGNARHTASTIELADFRAEYDAAVIDEAQMITDPFRGDRWLKAICGLRAREIHICMAPEATNLIIGILGGLRAAYTIVTHKRLAPLHWGGLMEDIRRAEPGDALIVFSRRAVLAVAAELQDLGLPASVIYGALPPVSRREEVRRFTEGETEVVVATDAIGMGVSLPIRRVIFCETSKFDGVKRRPLTSGEIKQVAGRAGRYGIYDEGYVLSMADGPRIRAGLTAGEKQAARMTIPFPEEALDSDWPLDLLLEAWNTLPREPGFLRVDMSPALQLYRAMDRLARQLDRRLLYGMITCPLDVENEGMVAYWLACCQAIHRKQTLPEPPSGFGSLEQCEDRYKELDIRHQLLRRIGVEEDRMEEKQHLCECINRFLQEDKGSYLRYCSVCGRRLPATYTFGVCERCFSRQNGGTRAHTGRR